MARLVSFGCSITYGQGLPDCYVQNTSDPTGFSPRIYPSKYAWPNILAQKLSLESDNKGIPGASNKEILLKVLDTKFNRDDIVILLWSYTQRSIIFENKDSKTRFLPFMPESNIKKEFYTLHTEHDLIFQSVLDIHHANMFLLNKDIKVYNFYFDELLSKSPLVNILPKIVFMPLTSMHIDNALDNMHPGLKSNEKIAEFLIEHITS